MELHTAQLDSRFTRHVVALRRRHPVFRRRSFYQGRAIRGAAVKDLTWLDPRGKEMTDEAWNAGFVRSLMVRLAGDAIAETDERGRRIVDETFLLLLNASDDSIMFHLPSLALEMIWERTLDTAETEWARPSLLRTKRYRLQGRSFAVLRMRPRPTPASTERKPPPVAPGA